VNLCLSSKKQLKSETRESRLKTQRSQRRGIFAFSAGSSEELVVGSQMEKGCIAQALFTAFDATSLALFTSKSARRDFAVACHSGVFSDDI